MSAPHPLQHNVSANPAAAFDAMVCAHYAKLCALAFRLVGSRPGAEDVVHEVLLRIWRGRDRFGFDDPLRYLFQAVRNEATSWHRQETAWRTHPAVDAADAADERPDAQEVLELTDLARVVEDTVAGLPLRRREIFRMQREQGLTYRQIAFLLGISIKTVEVQMGRALKAIRLRAAPFLLLTIALLK